jgi:hypothetical protein
MLAWLRSGPAWHACSFAFGPCMSRRHGQSQHIGGGSGVAIGHQPCEPGDLGSEDGLC